MKQPAKTSRQPLRYSRQQHTNINFIQASCQIGGSVSPQRIYWRREPELELNLIQKIDEPQHITKNMADIRRAILA